MECFNVFLDSNVFIGEKFNFNSTSLSSLKQYLDSGLINLYTNDIVLKEVKRNIKSELEYHIGQASKIINKPEFRCAISKEENDYINKIFSNAPQKLESVFDSYVEGAIVLDYNTVSVTELFDNYFNTKAPFEESKEKKAEFPDAVIIMSIEEYLKNENILLHVVTNDNGWENAFKGNEKITVHKKLRDFLSFVSKGNENYKYLIEFYNSQKSSLSLEIKKWLDGQAWQLLMEYVRDIECTDICDYDVLDIEFKARAVEYLDDKKCSISVIGKAEIELEYDYIDHSEEMYDREDHEWYNTIYGTAKSTLETPIKFSLDININNIGNADFSIEKIEFDDSALNNIDEMEYQELMSTKYNDYDDFEKEDEEDYYDLCPDCGCKINFGNDGGNGFCTECAFKH